MSVLLRPVEGFYALTYQALTNADVQQATSSMIMWVKNLIVLLQPIKTIRINIFLFGSKISQVTFQRVYYESTVSPEYYKALKHSWLKQNVPLGQDPPMQGPTPVEGSGLGTHWSKRHPWPGGHCPLMQGPTALSNRFLWARVEERTKRTRK